MDEGLSSAALEGVEVRVLDLDADLPDRVLFTRPPMGGKHWEERAGREMLDDWTARHDLPIGSRQWRVEFRASPEWIETRRSSMPISLASLAAALASWVFLSLRKGMHERMEIEEKVAARTQDLTRAKHHLEELVRERERAELGLLRTQYVLLAAQRLGQIGSWERDLDSNELVWSDEVYSIFGRSRESFVPTMERFMEAVHPEDRGKLQSVSEASLKAGKPFGIEYRILLPDGEVRHVVVHAEMVPGEHGRMSRIQGAIQDITSRKQDELLLLEAQSQLVTAQRLGHIGSWDYDFRRAELKWSAETCRICGYEPGQVTPTPEVFYALLHPEDRDRVKTTEARALQAGSFTSVEHRIVRPNGEVRWVVGRSEVQRDVQGKTLRVVGTIQDVTEAKQAEFRRQAVERSLLEVKKLESLGLMAGGVAHEFNNLLSGILGSANLVRAELPRGSRLHEHLERVETSAQRAADLTAQMLAYAGQGKLANKPLRLPALVRDCLLLMQASVGKRLAIELELDPATPLVLGDASQIRMLVVNLVLNAAEAMHRSPGSIMLSSRRTRLSRVELDACHLGAELPEGVYAELRVCDQGEGITAEDLEKIFDPFFSTRFKGRGLGLAAVLGIVRGHGGAIAVATEIGKGSCFTVYLPESELMAGVESDARAPAVGQVELDPPPGIASFDGRAPRPIFTSPGAPGLNLWRRSNGGRGWESPMGGIGRCFQ